MGRARREQRLAEEAAEQAARKGVRLGIRRILTRLARRILRLEVSEVASVVERGEDGVAFAEEASRTRWRDRWESTLAAPLEELAVEVGERKAPEASPLPPSMQEYLTSHVSELANTLSATSYQNVRDVIEETQREGLSVPQAAARLREREPDISASRASLIARNETLVVSKGASYHQALNSGLPLKKKRLTAGDSRVREEHAAINGETVGLAEPYSNGEVWSGQLSINCRCNDLFIPVED